MIIKTLCTLTYTFFPNQNEVYWRYNGVFALDFIIPFFDALVNYEYVEKYHVSSTFKAHRIGRNFFFVIVANVNSAVILYFSFSTSVVSLSIIMNCQTQRL
jgi:hypothetical protein